MRFNGLDNNKNHPPSEPRRSEGKELDPALVDRAHVDVSPITLPPPSSATLEDFAHRPDEEPEPSVPILEGMTVKTIWKSASELTRELTSAEPFNAIIGQCSRGYTAGIGKNEWGTFYPEWIDKVFQDETEAKQAAMTRLCEVAVVMEWKGEGFDPNQLCDSNPQNDFPCVGRDGRGFHSGIGQDYNYSYCGTKWEQSVHPTFEQAQDEAYRMMWAKHGKTIMCLEPEKLWPSFGGPHSATPEPER